MRQGFTNGFFFCDDRSSGGKLQESAVGGCIHCQKSFPLAEWNQVRPICHNCDGPLCIPCARRAMVEGCTYFVKEIERSLEEMYRRQQNAKVLGL